MIFHYIIIKNNNYYSANTDIATAIDYLFNTR